MSARVDALVESTLAPADAVRAALLRRTGSWARALLRDRDLRAAWLGAFAVALAFALAVLAPASLLFAGPLLLGVPHLLADLRYLVVRQELHRRRSWLAFVVPCLALSVVAPRQPWALLAVALSAVIAEGTWLRRASACVAVIAAACALRLDASGVVLAHLHNLVALYLWTRWARSAWSWLPATLLFAFACASFASGLLDDSLLASLVRGMDGAQLQRSIESLSPTQSPLWALRFVGFFAFAQAVHYAIWTRVIPEHDRARAGIRSFRASYRALRDDLGLLLPASILVTLGLVLVGLTNAELARGWYLRLAVFHGPLELSVLMLFAVEGRTFASAR